MPREHSSTNESAHSRLLKLEEKQLRGFRNLAVVGDLHGDYQSLLSVLKMVDPKKDGIIFLGDYVDRGHSSIEVIDAVDSLIKNHPQSVFALKGNHEDFEESGEAKCDTKGFYSLKDEVLEKVGDWQRFFKNKFKSFERNLQLAIIAPGETLFVHGGISRNVESLNDILHPTKEIEEDLLWSDPFEGNGEHRPNPRRGVGVEFGIDVTTNVCRHLGVKKIVRSHDPWQVRVAGGPCYSHGGRVLTTSTTTGGPGYSPFILSINTTDFSISCYRILPDGSSEKGEIVSCKV